MAGAIEAENPTERRAVDAFFESANSVQGRLQEGAESHVALGTSSRQCCMRWDRDRGFACGPAALRESTFRGDSLSVCDENQEGLDK